MDKILSPDFFEFGRSGRVYSREEALEVPSEEILIKLPFENFNVRLINTNVALVTYVSEVTYDEVEIANRSSIWLKIDTDWKLMFHQGTPINKI